MAASGWIRQLLLVLDTESSAIAAAPRSAERCRVENICVTVSALSDTLYKPKMSSFIASLLFKNNHQKTMMMGRQPVRSHS